ncbi:patatin-like phospholipase family protein [Clostridium sp. KNHs214]|uniref:patatin-like phospholipase family protein n=1 Tax=Clostridium sp. KNHs214 TaxID=1540257 RepID=UPI00068AA820|nr:patatin-like phospholipase family protein [Clostridium sp. KNHs214]
MNSFVKAMAVFEGGGIRGIGIVGALKSFEEYNYIWKRAAGTSVGAIIAALVIAGYKAEELEKILSEMDFIKFLDKDSVNRIPVFGMALGIFRDKGIYSGDYFENWIKELLEKKGIVKFKDVMENGESKLKVITSDITLKRKVVLPDDLVDYGEKPGEFSVAKAVRMSISIPLYFKPVEFKHKDGISYMVDGGVTCNYPIDIFDTDNIKIPIIGFKFKAKEKDESLTSKGKNDPMSFLFDIASTMSEYSVYKELSKRDATRTVFIPVDGVKSTEFNITKEKTAALYKAGYYAGKEFLEIWDFKDYQKRFIIKNNFKSNIYSFINNLFSKKKQ